MQTRSFPAASVKLADIFLPQAVMIGLTRRTKAGAIRELVHRLVELGRIAPELEESLVEMVLAREHLGSTALGHGIAFPHCRASVTESFCGAVAVDRAGIEFDALDKDLVHVVFLLVGPLADRESYFEVLGRIGGIGRQKPRLLQLKGCRSSEEVHRRLCEWDAEDGHV